MVDTVLYFEGDTDHAYRGLRTVKNRFGSTNEIGLFEMREDGMAEVLNPSEMLLGSRGREAPGTVVTASLEGTRPVLVEVQALVSPTVFGMPRRQAAGVDYNRMVRVGRFWRNPPGYGCAIRTWYVNVAADCGLVEPAADLGVRDGGVFAFGIALPQDTAVSARWPDREVRPVRQAELRLGEADRACFFPVNLPRRN
jgi:DNA repair protein RadA/Sms